MLEAGFNVGHIRDRSRLPAKEARRMKMLNKKGFWERG